LSNRGFPLRYRLELAPLSDLYLVYSRGGVDTRSDEMHSFGQQFASTLNQRTGDQFYTKITCRF
jgi:hypothetical protein